MAADGQWLRPLPCNYFVPMLYKSLPQEQHQRCSLWDRTPQCSSLLLAPCPGSPGPQWERVGLSSGHASWPGRLPSHGLFTDAGPPGSSMDLRQGRRGDFFRVGLGHMLSSWCRRGGVILAEQRRVMWTQGQEPKGRAGRVILRPDGSAVLPPEGLVGKSQGLEVRVAFVPAKRPTVI